MGIPVLTIEYLLHIVGDKGFEAAVPSNDSFRPYIGHLSRYGFIGSSRTMKNITGSKTVCKYALSGHFLGHSKFDSFVLQS